MTKVIGSVKVFSLVSQKSGGAEASRMENSDES
jgi:hypothetical protein